MVDIRQLTSQGQKQQTAHQPSAVGSPQSGFSASQAAAASLPADGASAPWGWQLGSSGVAPLLWHIGAAGDPSMQATAANGAVRGGRGIQLKCHGLLNAKAAQPGGQNSMMQLLCQPVNIQKADRHHTLEQ